MINISMNVIVQITSNSMNGTLTYNGTDYNISGSKIKIIFRYHSYAVKIDLQKNNNVGGNLTVRLLQGRKIIEIQSTSANQEVVTTSHNF